MRPRPDVAGQPGGEQEQGRAEPLATGGEDVFADAGDQGNLGAEAVEDTTSTVQIGADGACRSSQSTRCSVRVRGPAPLGRGFPRGLGLAELVSPAGVKSRARRERGLAITASVDRPPPRLAQGTSSGSIHVNPCAREPGAVRGRMAGLLGARDGCWVLTALPPAPRSLRAWPHCVRQVADGGSWSKPPASATRHVAPTRSEIVLSGIGGRGFRGVFRTLRRR
jgi:hypothetical protein